MCRGLPLYFLFRYHYRKKLASTLRPDHRGKDLSTCTIGWRSNTRQQQNKDTAVNGSFNGSERWTDGHAQQLHKAPYLILASSWMSSNSCTKYACSVNIEIAALTVRRGPIDQRRRTSVTKYIRIVLAEIWALTRTTSTFPLCTTTSCSVLSGSDSGISRDGFQKLRLGDGFGQASPCMLCAHQPAGPVPGSPLSFTVLDVRIRPSCVNAIYRTQYVICQIRRKVLRRELWSGSQHGTGGRPLQSSMGPDLRR